MNDDLKARETLSAVLDDEANELELARLLKQPLAPELLAAMRRYQSVRTVLAGQRQVATFDISARVAAALQNEPLPAPRTSAAEADQAPPASVAQPKQPRPGEQVTPRKARWQLLGGAAVAASVAFAVMFSAHTPQTGSMEAPAQLAQVPAVAPVQIYPEQLQSRAPTGQPMASLASAPVAERSMDEEQLRRLNEYLIRHAEHAARSNGQAVVPFARMAGFEASQHSQR